MIALQAVVEDGACLRVQPDLFAEHHAGAALHGAADLRPADLGVDGLADVVHAGEIRQAAMTGIGVDLHLREVRGSGTRIGLGPVGVRREQSAFAVVRRVIRDVGVAQRCGGVVGAAHRFVFAVENVPPAVPDLLRVVQQLAFQDLCRLHDGAPEHEDGTARVAAVVDRVVERVALGDRHARGIQGQHLAHDLLERQHAAAAVIVDVAVDGHRAVLFHLDHDGAPVRAPREVAGRVRADGHADAPQIAAVLFRASLLFLPAEQLRASVHDLGQRQAAQVEIAHFRDRPGRQDALLAESDRVLAVALSCHVHEILHGEAKLRTAPAPVAAGDGRVRAHGNAVDRRAVHIVRPVDLLGHGQAVVRADGLIRAGVQQDVEMHAGQFAVCVELAADECSDRVAQHRAGHDFRAVQPQFDGPSRRDGARRGQRLQDHLLLAAERPAHGRLVHADLVHVHAEDRRDGAARAEDRLRAGPDFHLAAACVVIRHRAVVLHGDVRRAGRGRQLGQLLARIRFVVAERDHVRPDDLIRLMDGDLRAGQGLLRRKISGILFDLQRYEARRQFRRLLRLRQHRSDAVADEADVIREQRLLVGHVFARPHAAAVVFHLRRVAPVQDLDHAGHCLRARNVHLHDLAVGHGAEDELHVQHAGQMQVAGVQSAAGSLVLGIEDGIVFSYVLEVHVLSFEKGAGALPAPACLLLQLNFQEGLLAFLEQDAVLAEHILRDGLLGIGHLLAVHQQAALLDRAEAFAVGGHEACLLDQADQADAVADHGSVQHLRGHVGHAGAARAERGSRRFLRLGRFLFAMDVLRHFERQHFLGVVDLGVLQGGQSLDFFHGQERQHAQALVHVCVVDVSPVLVEVVRTGLRGI